MVINNKPIKQFIRFRPSFSNKVLLYGLLFSLVPIITAVTLIVRNERTRLLDQTKRELNLITQAMAVEITRNIDELQHDAALIAKLPEIQSNNVVRKGETLGTLLDHHQRYGQLAIIDLDGQIQLTAKHQEYINITHIESFRRAAKGEQGWVIAPALFNDNLVLHMHTPVYSNIGGTLQQTSVLGSPTPLGNFVGVLSTYSRKMPGSTFILGSDNRVLIHEDQETRESRPDYNGIIDTFGLVDAPKAFEIGDGLTKNLIYEKDGVSFIASFNHVESLGWTFVAQKRLSVVLQPLRRTQIIGSISVSILASLSIFAALIVRNWVAKPIEDLAGAASELEVGNYYQPLPNDENQITEISSLIQAFSRMRKAVTDREQQLQSFSASLETQVEERTAELQKTAAHLKVSRDAAERANKAKDLFLARMSHELRTPLNAIIGYSELIQEFVDDEGITIKDAVKDARSIQQAGRHLLAIVNNVLNYSKIQAGKMDVDVHGFDLDRVLANALLTVKPMAQKNRNRIELSRPKFSGLIYSDELKIGQILINLLGNATKFTKNGSIFLQIAFHKGPRRMDRRTKGCLIMKITDTGIGIPESSVEKLFKPFSQVDESYNRLNEGTGLGLVLTKSFVELLGGTIVMQSRLGVGTQFEVKIPIEMEEALQLEMAVPAGS